MIPIIIIIDQVVNPVKMLNDDKKIVCFFMFLNR